MTTDLLASIHSTLPKIVEECDKLPFFSIEPDGSKKSFTLEDVMDPTEGLNKCAFTSQMITDSVDFSSLTPGAEAVFTGIQSPAGNHYAVLLREIGDTGDGVILDFTARQFDPAADFPLVMNCWDWQMWTESHLGRQGNWYHSYAW
jgi:hypothetical protein